MLPEEARQDEQREEKNPQLNEQRSVDVDELRLMRLGSRLQKQGQRGFHAQKPAARAAFVPPVRPLSTVRKSLPVLSLTINKPKGMEPSIYPKITVTISVISCIQQPPS